MASLIALLFFVTNVVMKCHSVESTIKLIIYDFDETISSEHIFHVLSHIGGGSSAEQLKALDKSNEGTVIRMFGGRHRIDLLKNHFETLTLVGINFAIVSLGYKGVIISALSRVGLSKYFDKHNVFGRESMHSNAIQFHKANLSALKVIFIKEQFKSIPSEQRLIVDNDQLTLRGVLKKKAGRIFDSEIVNGLTQAHLEAIEKSL